MERYVYRPFPSLKTLSFKTKLIAKPFFVKKSFCLHEIKNKKKIIFMSMALYFASF